MSSTASTSGNYIRQDWKDFNGVDYGVETANFDKKIFEVNPEVEKRERGGENLEKNRLFSFMQL